MIEEERWKTSKSIGYVFCELQVNDSYKKKTRILIAKNGTKSIIGREWLTTLRYKLAPEGELKVNTIESKKSELRAETKQFTKEVPKTI